MNINDKFEKFARFFQKEKSIEEVSLKENHKENDVGIQKSFVAQFAENQNHHQRLFIQFLSSVLVVIIAYAYVYSNTASKDGIHVYNAALRDSTVGKTLSSDSSLKQIVSVNIKAEKYNSSKYSNGSIITYSQLSLLSIYIFSQIVLLILSIMILHMGYSYRRDQCVVNKIRRINLGEAAYEKIFGTKNYIGSGKGFFEYLPNFNSILFFSICVIQTGLFISIFIYLNEYGNEAFLVLGKTFVSPPYDIKYSDLSASLFFPLLVNLFLYTYYYNKYEFTVNKKNTYVPLTIKIYNKKRTFLLYFLIVFVCMGGLLYSFFKVDSYVHLWTIFWFFAIIQASLITYFILDRILKIKLARYYSQLILGFIYIGFGIVLFFHSHYWFINLRTESKQVTKMSIILTASSVLLFVFSNWFSHKSNDIARYFQGYNRFLFVLFYVFLLIYFMELKWLDYAISGFFAIYSILIGRRTVLKWRYNEYKELRFNEYEELR